MDYSCVYFPVLSNSLVHCSDMDIEGKSMLTLDSGYRFQGCNLVYVHASNSSNLVLQF